MATMTPEEFQLYEKYGPNYQKYMRFGSGRSQYRNRNQFNPGGGFYHTDPVQLQKTVQSIMKTEEPPPNSPYLSDYQKEYERIKQQVLYLEDLMSQNQFANNKPEFSFEDFYNNYAKMYEMQGGDTSQFDDATQETGLQGNPVYAPVPVLQPPPVSSEYGTRLYTSPNDMYTMDFKDSDGDGVDDRYQTGPGQPREDVGSRYPKPGYSYPLPLPEDYKPVYGPNFKFPKVGDDRTAAMEQAKLAYEQMAANNSVNAGPVKNFSNRDDVQATPAFAPAILQPIAQSTPTLKPPASKGTTPDFGVNNTPAKPTMSDQFIPRYERDSSAFEPTVKKTVSKVTKVKAR